MRDSVSASKQGPLKLAIAIGAVGAVLVTVLIVLVRRPPTLLEQAHSLQRGLLAGDSNLLWSMLAPRDIEEAKYTKESVRKIMERIIEPSLRDLKVSGPTHEMDESYQGVLNFELTGPNGNRWRTGVYVWGTSEGGKVFIHDILHLAWQADYARRLDRALQKHEANYAGLLGRKRDVQFLESLGILGFTHANPDVPMRPWRESIQGMEARLKDISFVAPAGSPTRLD